jgi:signal transduction histidine kinase
MSDTQLKTLQDKAMLLLRREREVYDLRQARRRIEDWLQTVHDLPPDLRGADPQEYVRRWAALMVGKLSFERACAIEYEVPSGRVVHHHANPASAETIAVVPPELHAWLRELRSGTVDDGAPSVMMQFRETIGFHAFIWASFSCHTGTELVLIAGSTPRGAAFHLSRAHDLGHFIMVAQRVAALVDNAVLLAELVQSTRLVAEASRRAGMADIATGVLHNVGNVLNSVNVSAELVAERIGESRTNGIERLASLLEAQADPSAFLAAKAPTMVAYLRALATQAADERSAYVEELESLRHNLDHIRSIIAKQQAYARTSEASEECEPTRLMDDALSLAQAVLVENGAELVRDYAPLPKVNLDRHRVLQILVNLMTNASQAVATSPTRRVVARLRSTGEDRLQMIVEDTGVGIAGDHKPVLFAQGFTTKADGHGFGLHTSLLAAREMGGTLECESDGVGHGARFVLELPCSRSTGTNRVASPQALLQPDDSSS